MSSLSKSSMLHSCEILLYNAGLPIHLRASDTRQASLKMARPSTSTNKKVSSRRMRFMTRPLPMHLCQRRQEQKASRLQLWRSLWLLTLHNMTLNSTLWWLGAEFLAEWVCESCHAAPVFPDIRVSPPCCIACLSFSPANNNMVSNQHCFKSTGSVVH